MKSKIFAALLVSFYVLGFSASAFAAKYDIKEMTPEIQQAFDGRKGRYQQIQQQKSAGVLSENNDGLLQGSGDPSLVSAENADRMVIYQAIATQNNLGPNGLAEVQKAFAAVRREKDNS